MDKVREENQNWRRVQGPFHCGVVSQYDTILNDVCCLEAV